MNLENLEALRQQKRYGEVMVALKGEKPNDPEAVSIAVDATRGLMRRSYTPSAVKKWWEILGEVTKNRLLSIEFRDGMVDQNPKLAIGVRRDISRLGREIGPVIGNVEPGRRKILNAARIFTNDKSDLALMQIEEWRMNGGVEIGELRETMIKAMDENRTSDRSTAVIDWAMEIAVRQGSGIDPLLKVVDPQMSKKEKIMRIGRTVSRLGQEKARDLVLSASKNEINQEKMRSQWRGMVNVWG